MAIVYIGKTIPVPNVTALSGEPEVIGDFARTVGGKLRGSVASVARVWHMEAMFLTYEEYKAIADHLNNVYHTFTEFWLDEFGGTPETDSIMARIEIEYERTPFGRGGAWHSKGRSLSLTVTEQ